MHAGQTATRLAALLLVMVTAHAAGAAAQERNVGGKLGPSFATVAFEPEEGGGYDYRVALAGGGFAVLPLARRVALQVEALVAPKGGRLYDEETAATGAVLLHYLDIPVLMRVRGPRSGARSFYAFGGPYSGIRIGAKREVSALAGGIRSGVKQDMSSEVERFELGLVVGAGVDIGRRLVVDGRYSHGLTGLNTDKSDGFRIRNRTFVVMAGFRL